MIENVALASSDPEKSHLEINIFSFFISSVCFAVCLVLVFQNYFVFSKQREHIGSKFVFLVMKDTKTLKHLSKHKKIVFLCFQRLFSRIILKNKNQTGS